MASGEVGEHTHSERGEIETHIRKADQKEGMAPNHPSTHFSGQVGWCALPMEPFLSKKLDVGKGIHVGGGPGTKTVDGEVREREDRVHRRACSFANAERLLMARPLL